MSTLQIVMVVWIGSAVAAYGQWVYYFQTKYLQFGQAEESYWTDRVTGFFWALAGGPASLIIAVFFCRTYRGWKL